MKVLGIRAVWQAIPPSGERADWPAIRAEAEALVRAGR